MKTSKKKAKKATADKGLKRQVETEDVLKVTNNDKKLASNQRRLEALKKRRQEATTRVPVSISVDGRPTSSPGKHIVFSSDSDHENSDAGETEETLSRKPSLFDEEEEEEEEDEDASRFATRKQFEGSSGEKLFRLQQQIGTDKRFRLDERFADSNSSNGEDSSESGDDAGSDGGIEKERDQARRIIASLLGTTGSEAKNKDISLPSLLRHFDPSLNSCTDLEQTDLTPQFEHKSADDLILEDEEGSSPSPAPVGRETYYKISNSLKESLTGGDEERENKPHTFDFFAGEEDAIDEDDRDSAEEEIETTTVTPKWMRSIARKSMPSRGAKEEEEEEEDRGGTSHKDRKAVSSPDSSQRVLFFFHSSDPILANRLDENSFYRNKTAAELCEKWPERRAAVKLAYKRSQKQALKRTRKRDW